MKAAFRTPRSFAVLALFAALALPLFPQSSHADDSRHGGHEDHGHHEGRWHGDIHHFHDYDMGYWHSGHWYRGHHGHRDGWWWVLDNTWYAYPTPVYPYPDPYQPPIVTAPPVAIAPPAAAPPAAHYWYYCDSPAGYYPYVPACGTAWRGVPAAP